MAGLYIHVPFCKQACSYCNFHFSTRLSEVDKLVDALVHEIELRQEYLPTSHLQSVYFGGGTPSILSRQQLLRIWRVIDKYFGLSDQAEITLEANPDDLTVEKLAILNDTPVNRLSIGVQSFRDVDLQLMNRAHAARDAHVCIERAHTARFRNLTIDLIYGIPGLPDDAWRENLAYINQYEINHFSAYALTVEPRTLLAHQIKRQKIAPLSEIGMTRQFNVLLQFARDRNFTHYEISNFARPGFLAVHNSNYWRQQAYLGIGPSAHSFNGNKRSWNIANNAKYIDAIKRDELPFTEENLTPEQKYNEYVLTALRTYWGCERDYLKKNHGRFWPYFEKGTRIFLEKGWVREDQGTFTLTDSGKLFADHIAAELFMVVD